MNRLLLWVGMLLLAGIAVSFWIVRLRTPPVMDDAKAQGKTAADFPESTSTAMDEMDGGQPLSDEARRGRNTWLLWTAGDQTFWDGMAQHGLGTADLLKAIDSRLHKTRFRDMGLINQPGLAEAGAPNELGLWLDAGAQEAGVDPAIYGRPTGIIGLRLYPNPRFDNAARRRWDPQRYYTDPVYYNDPALVRPYVVGMSCAFCHVAFNPLKPPENPEKPDWTNLSSTIGNQYFNASAIFGIGASKDSYAAQLFHSWARGTVDTSFIATDNLNNPSNMNPIYSISLRLTVAHQEEIAGGALDFPGESRQMAVPHVLKDGADSVGFTGALSRVYVSIGEFSQQWLLDHNELVGGVSQKPFSVSFAQKNSVYWQATAQRIPNLVKFLMKMTGPRLQDAPGGGSFLNVSEEQLQRGKIVFAENCARCHSSKQPGNPSALSQEQYNEWMRREVLKPDFLENNFLSTEERIPVNTVGTNAARALATNAMRGHVWDNFSSETYKALPAVGEIDTQSAVDNTTRTFPAPPGGPGYYRVPSLISIWATAPFLHNNSVGAFEGDPSVAGRMRAFNDAITKLLWPEKRQGQRSIARTTVATYIDIPEPYLPRALQSLSINGFLRLGPIPAGTPIDLFANADLDLSNSDKALDRIRLIARLQNDLTKIRLLNLSDNEAARLIDGLAPDLLKISNCPDFVLDRGHYFGSSLSEKDKLALVEFLKTF
jgi:hypothetical protein